MCASDKTVILSEAIFPLSGLHTALRFLCFVITLNWPTAFLILVTKQATYPLTRGLSSPPFTTRFCSQLVLFFFSGKLLVIDCQVSVQINHQLDATISPVIYLTFIYSSTCFGRPRAHHQELNNCSSRL